MWRKWEVKSPSLSSRATVEVNDDRPAVRRTERKKESLFMCVCVSVCVSVCVCVREREKKNERESDRQIDIEREGLFWPSKTSKKKQKRTFS